MARIVHIGAGSAGFGKRFLADVLTRLSLRDATLVLMDVDPDNLDVMATLARRLKEQLDSPVRVEATTDRRRALDGADYVIITIVSNGFGPRYREVEIPRKYGLHHSVGCTSGPSGIFRGLRYVPVLLEICRDVGELCPDALILDYSNPTSIVPWAITRATGTRFVGLCHSVQHTAMTLARYLGVPYEETGHWVAGINHQAWFLRFEWRGQDAYPQGIHPCYVGDLPPQCAAVNRARQNQDELAMKGALEGDRRAVEQAVALDPLTASVCTLEQIRAMVAELFEADRPYLPQFAPLAPT